MNTMHVRNTIAILFVLTLANLAASFGALQAVHEVRALHDSDHSRIERIENRLLPHGNDCSVQYVNARQVN